MRAESIYLGLALAHFIWQGIIIAVGLYVALYFIRSASARYMACGLALFLMPVCLISTDWHLRDPSAGTFLSFTSDSEQIRNAVDSTPASPLATQLSFRFIQPRISEIYSWMPSVTSTWLVCVAMLFFRKAGGFMMVWRLGRKGIEAPSSGLQEQFHRVRKKLGVKVAQLQLSSSISVPITMGWFRPLVLLPVSFLSGLGSEELELILAHELAHIRRHDYLVNLLQTVVETLFFYHPVTWWISSRMRQERENACDDLLLVNEPEKALAYAKALVRLEKLRPVDTWPALAASGGSLLQRVRRVLGEPSPQTGLPVFFTVASLLLLVTSYSLAQADTMSAVEAKEKNIAALVNGEPILWSEVDTKGADVFKAIKEQTKGADQENKLSEARKQALKDLIDRKLILESCKNSGWSVPDKYLNSRINETVNNNYGGDRNAFITALKNRSMTLESYRKDLAETAIFYYMKWANSGEKAHKYYQEHLELFPQDVKINITGIAFLRCGDSDSETKEMETKAVQDANSALDQLKNGANFDDLVKNSQYPHEPMWVSHPPDPAVRGPYPYTCEGLSAVWPAIEKLQPGQISGIITTTDTYMIVRVNDRRAATVKDSPELDASEEKRYEDLTLRNAKEWMENLYSKAVIQRFE